MKTDLILAAALVVALGTAIRSTWSPCGLSMLSTITPVSERGRGYRFGGTAAWFVAGAVVGGACLGGVAVLLASLVSVLGASVLVVGLIGAGLAAMAAAGDAGLLGFEIPVLRRQVNERWLDQFRRWVYAGGFGWQIGVGVSTYIMTCGVFLTVALGALTGRPWMAFLVGVVFGTARGLAVFVGRKATSFAAMQALHQGLERWREPVRRGVIVLQAVVAVAVAAIAWWPAAVALAGAELLVAGGLLGRSAIRERRTRARAGGVGVASPA